MDPTSNEESTPWDPITGKLRAHANLKLPKGTRDALAKHTMGLEDARGLSSASTRCPTTAATSAATTAPGSPRRHSLVDALDVTQPFQSTMRKAASQTQLPKMTRSSSVPRPMTEGGACGSGGKAVRFLADPRSPSRERLPTAMQADPGRYDLKPSRVRQTTEFSSPSIRRQDSTTSSPSTGRANLSATEWRRDNLPAAMRADPARYDVAFRGSAAARDYENDAKHIMHMKADPRNDMLNDGSGHNADGDGQTLIGMEIRARFTDMRTAFIAIDTDFDGRVTHEELMQACYNWNIPLSEASRVLDCTDVDQKGYIDFDEFARRFDPTLEITDDDEEILRLYQEGVMGDEQPLSLAGVQHGTSTAEPLVDEAKHYRTENGDLRGRLARSMRKISDLDKELEASRAHAAALESSLHDARMQNAQLQGRNAALESSLSEANSTNARLQGRNAELEDCAATLRRKLEEAEADKRRMAREISTFWEDQQEDRLRKQDDDRLRRARDLADREEEEAAERRRLRQLERQLAEADAASRRAEEEDESKTVFVYGLEGCEKSEAVYKALEKARVPFQRRDFNKDKRFMAAAAKSGLDSSDAIYAPVVCLGDKAWWQNHDETQLIPFPQAVAMDLRRELGLNRPTPEKVRVDVDMDMEIYARFLSMQDAFLKLDDNQDGFITEDELVAKCRVWNIPTSEARRVILEADRDNKGFLDFEEFAKRFGGLWNNGSRGPLRGLAPAPHRRRPCSTPPVPRR